MTVNATILSQTNDGYKRVNRTMHDEFHNKIKNTQLNLLDELERNQKKENHPNSISKMMGTLVHVQLYTFSFRKAVIRPQNMPKTADWG